ncbi:hypothetical protein CS053_08470 [Rhodanobacter glycinis]|uniref:Uncharacterized protein n=1 Tax=Rhodanobacter glycinis TaxID=582702 RepID=A0A5B9DWY2_9GAMM|nr:hypothetical protein [Rhodanobacter glycinis]QEE24532.1 hypothetical protein CS053_08470 [Rhodanobacter glycinis]
MRYRKLDENGDYTFGNSSADFYIDEPEAVSQAVQTRLELFTGEWFLDTSDGTPWNTDVLGKNTSASYDMVIKERILGTPGVMSIDSYSSTLDRNTRNLAVAATVTTQYGKTTVQATL